MGQRLDIPGPGTGMAIAAGLAAYGAGVGELQHEGLILGGFIVATVVIEALHMGARLGARYMDEKWS